MSIIAVERPFDFRLMLLSHGWIDLPPFRWNEERRELDAVVRLASGRPLALRLTSSGDGVSGQSLRLKLLGGRRLTPAQAKRVNARIAWMLRLDDDYVKFHRHCRRQKGYGWIAKIGLGPFLRNADLFEEFAKTLLTTNINWAGTKSMNAKLIEAFGDTVEITDGEENGPCRAFPLPATIAGSTEAVLRRDCRLGYRAPYLLELAESVASGEIRLERFMDPALSTEELVKSLSGLKGFGPYAVNSLLMSLGRYERLVIDSWIRKTVAKRHFKSPRVTDRTIERFYAPWGEWRALACWFDCAHESWMRDDIAKG